MLEGSTNEVEETPALYYAKVRFNVEEYIKEVKKQLWCNATKEYKETYVTYFYMNEDIDNNLEYFTDCKNDNLSPYKALLFFYDYLKERE